MPHTKHNRRKRLSMRVRLTVWVVAIFALIQITTGLGYFAYQYRVAWRVFDERLMESSQAMANAIESRLPGLTAYELEVISRNELGLIQFELFEADVVSMTGDSLVYNAPRWPDAMEVLNETGAGASSPVRMTLPDTVEVMQLARGHSAQLQVVPMSPPTGPQARLVVVTSDAFVQQQLRVVRRVLAFGGAFGLLASAVSGWFLSGIAVEPFQSLREAAGQIRPETIEREIVVEEGGSEVAALAAELEAARARMQRAFSAQERFLSNVSHELKTPIATLLVEAQTTSRQGLTRDGLEFVRTVEEEMRKLGRLIESFLMLTRVSNSGGPDRAQRYSANEIVMDAVEDCLAMAEQYGVRIEPSLADDDVGLEAELVGDADLLRTLLNNLIRNAVRFNPRGKAVVVRARCGERRFIVTVRDHGPGLGQDVIDRVFDRFAQAEDEVRRERGHGLGLAIAKGIAELHRGDVTVRNHPEGGAEFRAELPLARSSGSSATTESSS